MVLAIPPTSRQPDRAKRGPSSLNLLPVSDERCERECSVTASVRLRALRVSVVKPVTSVRSPMTHTQRSMKTERELAQQNIAENRKAFHDYHIVETFEAGVALLGTEVKSIREGNVNLRDSFARVEAGEVWIYNVHISPYSHRGYSDHEPTRRRKLLLHRQEIRKLIGKTVEKGMTLVPTRMYFKNGHVKVAISLAKGKKAHDKRETIKRRETERETRAAVKERRSR